MTPNDRPGTAPEPGQRKIAELEAELARATRRIESLEASMSLRVGRLIVDAARSPRTVVRLPFQLLRLARRRGRRAAGGCEAHGRADAAPPVPVRATHDERLRFVSHTAVALGPRTRLSIATIARPSTERGLSPDAIVNRILPHDATLVLERAEPDLVLVETAAFRAGHPWAFAGDPWVAERAQDLVAVVDTARALDRPVVLWRNTPDHEAIGIAALEARFDLVVPEAPPSRLAGWSTGVQLAIANGIGAQAARSREPIFVAEWDQRASLPARRAVEEALARIPGLRMIARADAGSPVPEALAALAVGTSADPIDAYRRHAFVIADPFRTGVRGDDQILEAVACGARVIAVVQEQPAGLDGLVVAAASVANLSAATERAIASGPATAHEHRQALRAIYRHHATPVMLDRLRRHLTLETRPAGARSVAVVAAPASDREADTLVAELGRQEERPTEVLLEGPWAAASRTRLVAALDEAGISSRAVPEGTGAGALTEAAWLWPWRPGAGADSITLLDLLLAGEISRPDVACLVDGPGGFGVRPEPGRFLVRTSLAAQALPGPEGWADRGLRTFGLPLDSAPLAR